MISNGHPERGPVIKPPASEARSWCAGFPGISEAARCKASVTTSLEGTKWVPRNGGCK